MKTKMTKEILAVIDMMQSQRRVLSILYNEILCDKHDYMIDLENFYHRFPLPEGMDTSRACFESVICYPLNDEIMTTEYDDLGNKFVFGF